MLMLHKNLMLPQRQILSMNLTMKLKPQLLPILKHNKLQKERLWKLKHLNLKHPLVPKLKLKQQTYSTSQTLYLIDIKQLN